MTDGPALRPFLSLEGCGFLLVIFNSATRCSPILPANIVHCCHPVHEHPAMGVPREESASSTPEACCSVYRNVTNGWAVIQELTEMSRYNLGMPEIGNPCRKPLNRALTQQERDLIRWLIEHSFV